MALPATNMSTPASAIEAMLSTVTPLCERERECVCVSVCPCGSLSAYTSCFPDLLYRQKRPTIQVKETYYRGKRDLL